MIGGCVLHQDNGAHLAHRTVRGALVAHAVLPARPATRPRPKYSTRVRAEEGSCLGVSPARRTGLAVVEHDAFILEPEQVKQLAVGDKRRRFAPLFSVAPGRCSRSGMTTCTKTSLTTSQAASVQMSAVLAESRRRRPAQAAGQKGRTQTIAARPAMAGSSGKLCLTACSGTRLQKAMFGQIQQCKACNKRRPPPSQHLAKPGHKAGRASKEIGKLAAQMRNGWTSVSPQG